MLTVECGAGRVAGRSGADGLAFLGIPYAVAARWAPPRPPAPWTGTRQATVAGPAAPQPHRPVGEFTHGPLPEADEAGCLNLNVFTPGPHGARPVFVFIHGGGFAVGHGAASLYDARRLAAEADVVVVTLNYRLGSLGWLAHHDRGANWGLQDQIVALRWVHDNIAAFGGDPARVTLGGQSAGALSAMDLLVAPAAAGLFHRAVIQSPPMADVGQPLDAGTRWAQALAGAAGGWKALRALDAERVVGLHEALLEDPAFRGTRGGALPTVDETTLPRSPRDVPGARPEIDVLIGHAAQEGSFFFDCPWRPSPPEERIAGIVAHLCHTDAPQEVLAAYRERPDAPGDLLSTLVDIATDAMVAEPLAQWSQQRAATGRVFRYRVDHPGAGPRLRATHTVEVPLLFGTWSDGGAGERLGGQAPGAEVVARAIRSAWGGFIHDGNPGWTALAAGGGVQLFGGKEVTR